MTPRLLDSIDRPQDLHGRSEEELAQIAQEVREHIIDTVGTIGGHFGANLGTCELAVALHSLLDSPRDKLVWDVGHQAYPHKVLTGRRDQLPTIRQYEGLAPFCSIAESEHDIMGAGHASTSIGYAVGLKEGMKLRGDVDAGNVVAVIGDGAMTGGVAFEAIHQAGGLGTPIVVVLNDNGMSIAPNVGALSRYFKRMRLNPKWWHAREGVEQKLTELPGPIGAAIERVGPQLKESLKAFWAPGLFWEELDWAYVGVIDGHDVRALRRALRQALAAERPVVVHISTVKGKGFAPAEDGGLEGMEQWHAAKPKSIVDGLPAVVERQVQRAAVAAAVHVGVRRGDGQGGAPRPAGRRDHRGDELGHGPQHPPEGRARPLLRRRHRRAAGGPVRRRPRARGRQAGLRDLLDVPAARLRPDRPRRLPAEAERRLRHGSRRPGRRRRADPPRRVRHRLPALPAQPRARRAARRAAAARPAAHRAALRRRPVRAALPARRGGRRAAAPTRARSRSAPARCCGPAIASRWSATGPASARRWRPPSCWPAHGIEATVADARFAKPLDRGLLAQLAAEHPLLVTVEEGVLAGGFGSAVWEELNEAGVPVPRMLRVGMPDRYVTHGKPALLHTEVGYTGKAIAQRIEAALTATDRLTVQ